MSTFKDAIDWILKHEGGLVDNPSDPGGLTNFGISKRWANSQGLCLDIANLTIDEAKSLYEEYFWNPYPFRDIQSQRIATKIFDLNVNMGNVQAFKLAQRACQGTCTVDGQIGPKSVAAINAIPEDTYLAALVSLQMDFYLALIAQKPKLAVFKNGWLKRAKALP
jgi:lysozyme family protein